MRRKKQKSLPIIESCEGCGACCLKMCSPPGYVMILSDPSIADDPGPFAEDVERMRQLPEPLKQELLEYLDWLKRERPRGERPCLWFDQQRRTCKHYEHRPSICRDAVQVGDESCRAWRQLHQVKPY